MSVNVTALPYFQRRARRLLKRFHTLESELADLVARLKQTPRQGNDLGAGLYKIRLSSQSKGKGKSGGFRVITYYVHQQDDVETVYLVTIYDKSEDSSIAKADLLAIVQEIFGA